MNVIIANDLANGLVAFQTRGGWTPDINLAEMLDDKEASAVALERAMRRCRGERRRRTDRDRGAPRRDATRAGEAARKNPCSRTDDRKLEESPRRRDLRRGGLTSPEEMPCTATTNSTMLS